LIKKALSTRENAVVLPPPSWQAQSKSTKKKQVRETATCFLLFISIERPGKTDRFSFFRPPY